MGNRIKLKLMSVILILSMLMSNFQWVPNAASKALAAGSYQGTVSVSFDKQSPQPVNNRIVISASATAANLLYKFWIHDGYDWKVVQDYSDRNTYNWIPSKPGDYKVWVDVKDKYSTQERDKFAEVYYKVKSISMTSVNTDKTSPQRANTNITVTAASTGCNTPLYKFWIHDGAGWKVVQDYSEKNTYSWTPTATGNYRIWVDVKDKGSTSGVDAYKEIYYSIKDVAKISSISFDKSSPRSVNNKILMTANASGSSNILYKFWIHDGASWKVVQDYSTNKSYSWIPTKPGTYKIWVDVKDKNSSLERDSYYEASYVIRGVTLTSITTDKTSPQRANTNITVTAASTGCNTPLYKFWIHDGAGWKVVQDYSEKNTYSWTPTATGNYRIWVDVKDKGSTSGVDAYKEIYYSIKDVAKISSISFDKSSPRSVNNKILMTANASGSSNILYKFWIHDGASWKVVQDYSTNKSYSWIPTKPGNYKIWVDVKDKNSSLERDSYYEASYVIRGVTLTSITTDKTSPQRTNTNITVTAASTGCNTPLYKFWIHDGASWKVVQDYSEKNIYSWTPTATGSYRIWVDVKDKGSTSVSDAYKEIYYSIKDVAVINSITVDKPAPQPMYNKLTITANASGGSNILYRFWIHDGISWKVVRDFSYDNKYIWTPDKIANYTIWVDAKTSTSTNSYDSSKEIAYKIDNVKINSITTDLKSPQQALTKINISANATGSSNILYRFWIGDKDGWKIIQDYSRSSTCAWTPIASGNYNIWVDIKDQYSRQEKDNYMQITYSISSNAVGNLPNNITNFGLTATDGTYIYYPSSTDYTLTKNTIAGNNKTKLTNDEVAFINVSNGWIYYRNDSDNGSLYKIKTDGTSRTKLVDGNISYINVIGQWLYYCDNTSTASYLSRISLNGTTKERIKQLTATDVAGDVIIEDGWVYYTDTGSQNIFKVKIDGSNFIKLSNDKATSLTKHGSYLFYANGSDEGKIYRIGLNGLNKTKIIDDMPISMNATNGWVYYCHYGVFDDGTEGWYISKVNLDGSKVYDMIEDMALFINLCGDYVYYFNPSDGSVCRIKTDGTNYSRLD